MALFQYCTVLLLFFLLDIVLLALGSNTTGQCKHTWLTETSYDGLRWTTPHIGTNSSSRLECGLLCSSYSECMAFTYEKTSQLCQLHWRLRSTGTESFPGARTYHLPKCRKTCPEGWTQHLCFACLKFQTVPRTWLAAAQSCQALGGRLAAWDTRVERYTYIGFILADLAAYKETWVGASDESSEGTFVWHHNGAKAFIPWNNGEPSGGTYRNCVSIGAKQVSPTRVVYTFITVNCAATRKYFCDYVG